MARLGRKLLLTKRTTEDLCAAFSIGATIEIACSYAGVCTGTYYGWGRKAKEVLELLAEDPQTELTPNQVKYLKFFNKVEQAQSYAAIGWLQVIDNAARNDPTWAKFMLKVRYPDGFNEVVHQKVEIRDWRKEAKAAGLNLAELEDMREQLTKQMYEKMMSQEESGDDVTDAS